MRASQLSIKQAILHPQPELRLSAIRYFANALTGDPTVMPLVIQAVEQYGRAVAKPLLQEACHLPQTPATIAWLVDELQWQVDLPLQQQSHRRALGMILHHAPLDLLTPHQSKLLAPGWLPAQLRSGLDERWQMAAWDWKKGWEALEQLALDAAAGEPYRRQHLLRLDRVIEALARHRTTKADAVLRLLRQPSAIARQRSGQDLHRLNVKLAGEMQLTAAIPLLVRRLHGDDADLAAECSSALRRIGGDAVVENIAQHWCDGDENFRAWAVGVLEAVHSELCVRKTLQFMACEKDIGTQLALSHCLLCHFAHQGIVPMRRLLLAEGADQPDLKASLVAAAAIMGTRFPEFGAWWQQTLEKDLEASEPEARAATRPHLAESSCLVLP